MEPFIVTLTVIAAIVTIVAGSIVVYEWLQSKRYKD
jgi:hypothetical protein